MLVESVALNVGGPMFDSNAGMRCDFADIENDVTVIPDVTPPRGDSVEFEAERNLFGLLLVFHCAFRSSMDGTFLPVATVGSKNIVGRNITNAGNETTYNIGHQSIRVGAEEDVLRALRDRVVAGAMHDSKEVDDQGTCHPGTRIIVLEDVAGWIKHLDSESALMWMKGAAGAGKSAIARTVAKQLAEEGLLLASFFCLRSNDSRSDGSLVIPTLVEQIITRIPSVIAVVEAAFRADPRLFTKSLDIQARRLIVEPLASVEPERRHSLPRVIVIDGLDEIKGAQAQCDILKTIAFLIDNLPFPVRFFVTSRPEHQIQDYFAQSMGDRWSYVSLDENYHPDRDILIYYKAHFSLVVAAFPAYKLESDWPGEAVRRALVARGSGQFIFAAIVIRFVGTTSTAISPQKRLEMILENVSNDKLKPLALLDLIYVTVFKAVPKEELTAVLQLVGLVLLPLNFKKSPRVIDAVLCLESGTTENRLRYLHSVLKVPSSPDEDIAPLHATLGDFVFNRERSHSFGLHLDQEQFQQTVVQGILQGSMAHPESEQLNDCRAGWLMELYYTPISDYFVANPTFRTALASRIRELQGRDITLWPPFALMITYPVALDALKRHSSWLDLKDYLSWQILEKKISTEVSRRLRSYLTAMGNTGQMLLFIQLFFRNPAGDTAVPTFLEALPDQDVLANQKYSGLAFPNNHNLSTYCRGDIGFLLAETFVEPSFLETFFTLFSWQILPDLHNLLFDIKFAFSLHRLNGGDAYLIRLLSLRNLPQNDPRWDDEAKLAFNTFLDKVVDKAAGEKAGTQERQKFEAAKIKLLERASAAERLRSLKNPG